MVRRRIPPPKRERDAPHLREGTADDIPFVRTLSEEVFEQFGDYGTFLPSYLEHASVFTIIAESGDRRPMGFMMLALVTSSRMMPWDPAPADEPLAGPPAPAFDAEILAIAVRPEQQSRGCGRRMIDYAVSCAQEWSTTVGVRSVQLNVADTNHRARRLFEQMGFQEVDPFDGVYPKGQRSIRMARRV